MTSGFQHKVEKFRSARMSIMPVEPPAEIQEAYKNILTESANICLTEFRQFTAIFLKNLLLNAQFLKTAQ